MIRVPCPACGFTRDFPDHFAGQELPCRSCLVTLTVGEDSERGAAQPGQIRRFLGAYAATILTFLAAISYLIVWIEPRHRGSGPHPVPLFGYPVFFAAFVGLFLFPALAVACLRFARFEKKAGVESGATDV